MSPQSELSSRERILCTLLHKEPDHVPLWNLWLKKDLPFPFRDQRKRVEAVLKLDLDDSILVTPLGPGEDELITDVLVDGMRCPIYGRHGYFDTCSNRYWPKKCKYSVNPVRNPAKG